MLSDACRCRDRLRISSADLEERAAFEQAQVQRSCDMPAWLCVNMAFGDCILDRFGLPRGLFVPGFACSEERSGAGLANFCGQGVDRPEDGVPAVAK
jgi:hypothetical protein